MNGNRAADTALRNRAAAVIPGGMYGHQSVAALTPRYPQFMAYGNGPYVRDVDGNEYVDLMCSYGPVVLGHKHPIVEAAVQKQNEAGNCFNAPSPRIVELAELLVDTIDDATWSIFAKNGTDATTACVTIARASTGRSIILAAEGCYHGSAPWCTPKLDGVLPSDRAAIRYFTYNDKASLQRAITDAGSDLAAIIVTPVKQIEGLDQELVDPSFARQLRKSCDATGARLILDDVRCGFRMHLGGSWEPLGIRPDLSAWSKALANGYPIAAVTGTDAVKDAASEVFLTGSFWFNALPMVAAMATIEALRDEGAVEKMLQTGVDLRNVIEEQAKAHSLNIRYTGHPTMPYLTFPSDEDFERMEVFASSALDAGLYITPRHNWFINAALDEVSVRKALEATDRAFSEVTRVFGND